MSTGSALIGAGAGMMGGGGALFLVGIVAAASAAAAANGGDVTTADVDALIADVCLVAGVAVFAAGTALLVVGIVRKVRYKRAVEAWGRVSIQYSPVMRAPVFAWSVAF